MILRQVRRHLLRARYVCSMEFLGLHQASFFAFQHGWFIRTCWRNILNLLVDVGNSGLYAERAHGYLEAADEDVVRGKLGPQKWVLFRACCLQTADDG
ncbi:hypothetical protein SLA2020_450940 [Shorea laevis]